MAFSSPSAIPSREEASNERFERILLDLRKRICLLDFPPGTVLSETHLAKEFDVSRTPIRRVLHRLEFEGLVQIRNGVGTIVTDIDLQTFKETYNFRMRLAELMGELYPVPIDDEHLNSMDQLILRAGELHNKKDIRKYGQVANDLQELLSRLTGNKPLRETIDLYYFRVARIWFTFLPQLNWQDIVEMQLAELTELRQAMARNDMRGVGQVRSLHLHNILSRISAYLIDRNNTQP